MSSPWPSPPPPLVDATDAACKNYPAPRSLAGFPLPPAVSLTDCAITELEAEPQEGPVEYKLHLLLRPRRIFSAASTGQKISGSYLSKSRSPSSVDDPEDWSSTASPPLALSNQSRQSRLQHLTTQLLWRLQQSSPHHSSSRSSLVLPILPVADLALSTAGSLGPLIAGLEESLGALYEIGVSDDGTLVGLTMDELEESLNVLRAMAFSLGCMLSVLRIVIVGVCQWEEEHQLTATKGSRSRKEKLWVAEVLVAPHLKSEDAEKGLSVNGSIVRNGSSKTLKPVKNESGWENEQLRVSLTGSTTSGKSSLIGTLSTSTLDNGRGKSRLSLLKHRHEIVSGVTSSLAQELIGYHDIRQANSEADACSIVNYSSGNVSSWTDIHNSSEPGRLVFVTDSAGHPKFRRTTVRGLISWAPHWTLCCVAADDNGGSSGKVGGRASSCDSLGSASRGIDLSKPHLELCLKLDLAMVVIITKLDLATRNGLRQTVAEILSMLKAAGRKPAIIPNHAGVKANPIPEEIAQYENDAVQKAIETVPSAERHLLVPIVLTSAVTGGGIGQVHALLRQLPPVPDAPRFAPPSRLSSLAKPVLSTLFHVDEVFTVGDSHNKRAANGANAGPHFILSGYLRYGSLETGDNLLLGPFVADVASDDKRPTPPYGTSSFLGSSESLPKDIAKYAESYGKTPARSSTTRHGTPSHLSATKAWHSIRIISLRYLRLPVRKLSQGQVGTLAISSSEHLFLNADPFVRRGMILTAVPMNNSPPPAYSRITALFADPNMYVNPGSSVTVYTASIRAPAKIVEVKIPEGSGDDRTAEAGEDLSFNDNNATVTLAEMGQIPLFGSVSDQPCPSLQEIEISFQFTNSREWIELGTKVLITPASGISMLSPPRIEPGGAAVVTTAPAGLDGFVGRIVGAS